MAPKVILSGDLSITPVFKAKIGAILNGIVGNNGRLSCRLDHNNTHGILV